MWPRGSWAGERPGALVSELRAELPGASHPSPCGDALPTCPAPQGLASKGRNDLAP